jgi:hypothetical protein
MLEHTNIPTLLSPKAWGGSKEPFIGKPAVTTCKPKAAEWLIPKRPAPPREEVIGKIRHLFRDHESMVPAHYFRDHEFMVHVFWSTDLRTI